MNTVTGVHPCCSMCVAVPEDPAAVSRRLKYVEYYLCTERHACTERVMSQQRAARALEPYDLKSIAVPAKDGTQS